MTDFKNVKYPEYLSDLSNKSWDIYRNVYREESYLKSLKTKQRTSIKLGLKKLKYHQKLNRTQQRDVSQMFEAIGISNVFELKRKPIKQKVSRKNVIKNKPENNHKELDKSKAISNLPKPIKTKRAEIHNVKQAKEKPLYKSVLFWIVAVIVICIFLQYNPLTEPPISWLFGDDDSYDKVGKFLQSIMMEMNLKLFVLILIALWGLNTHRNPKLKNPEVKKFSKLISVILCIWITPFILYYALVIIYIAIALIIIILFGSIGGSGSGPTNGPFGDSNFYDQDPYMFPEDKYFDDNYPDDDE